jgi:glycogen phosphorylase
VFTTHTPVAAGFDTFPPELINKYYPVFQDHQAQLKISVSELLAFGRRDADDANEPFNMAYLAMRGCVAANGVSRLHGAVSRTIFCGLYPRWPKHEIPIGYITNGIHVPSWDSPWADELWTQACGKARWRGTVEPLSDSIQTLTDEALWTFRAAERQDVVRYARQRLARHLGQRGAPPEMIAQALHALDPNVLTLGFARRFTAYKRPNLLLHDPERLLRLLTHGERPVQIIVAGKAHPQDEEGKRLVQAWLEFMQRPQVRSRAVFLEDYDMALAQELVQGVDVWINTPRRPWEACGTSGMKVLVNGGLNLSELDGWWAEAYDAEMGWALGDGREHSEPDWDSREAETLYDLLEHDIVPAFYTRDAHGIPRAWVSRIHASMAGLAPQFSSNRMVRDYVEQLYLPAATALQQRCAREAELARELHTWRHTLAAHWHEVHFGNLGVRQEHYHWVFQVQVYLGEVAPPCVRVELYADAMDEGEPLRQEMQQGDQITGAVNGYVYHTAVSASRPAGDFTPRIIPYHPAACVPMEATLILWQR